MGKRTHPGWEANSGLASSPGEGQPKAQRKTEAPPGAARFFFFSEPPFRSFAGSRRFYFIFCCGWFFREAGRRTTILFGSPVFVFLGINGVVSLFLLLLGVRGKRQRKVSPCHVGDRFPFCETPNGEN